MDFVPVREERFAIVLYGGISLAIYMNGIAQELLRMVRATASNAGALDDVEKVYRALAEAVPDGPARFVVDIVSGTSAGGINGVALAKALVAGNPNLDVLRDAWVEKSQIDDLLNDRSIWPGAAPASLLDGRYMYRILADTLGKMNTGTGPLADVLELYVTATDLRGRDAPIQLTGTRIEEPVHKTVFRFRHDQADSDFGPDCDRMLAFAARCTSSFPVAFEPMRFGDISPTPAERKRYAEFFPGKVEPGKIEDDRQYADGGYLDNRPFSYAIEAIPVMPRALPGGRVLFFVDPFPETDDDTPAPGPGVDPVRPYDFLENAKLAATTLPRRETIRDDIRAITAINQRLDRLGSLMKRRATDETRLNFRERPARPEAIGNMDLRDLVVGKGYGECYALYHHLRVYGATDTIANIVANLGAYERRSDEWQYLRQLVRAWRDSHYAAYTTPEHQTETAFLSDYDIDFRVRRLNDLRDFLDVRAKEERLPEVRAEIERQLGAFRRLLQARDPKELGIEKVADLGSLRTALEGGYGDFVAGMTIEERYEVAKKTYEANKCAIDAVMAGIGKALGKAFFLSSDAMNTAAAGTAARRQYEDFHWRDVTTFPFLEGTSAEEHCEVRIYRISPVEDDTLNDSPKKLAGIAVGAFGGFLSRDWRQHDILWGRLDGAERIVTALLPENQERREHFVDKLQSAIVQSEFAKSPERRQALVLARLKDGDVSDDVMRDLRSAVGANVSGDVEPSNYLAWFKDHYRQTTPLGPGGRDVAQWGSRSASILARMIDGLKSEGFLRFAGTRAAGGLRAGGVLSAQMTRFAIPGTFSRSVVENVLFIAIIAGLLLMVLGSFTNNPRPLDGAVIIAFASLMWVGLYLTARTLRGELQWVRWLAALGVVLLVFLALLGTIFLSIQWEARKIDPGLPKTLGAAFEWGRTHVGLVLASIGIVALGISLHPAIPRRWAGRAAVLMIAALTLSGGTSLYELAREASSSAGPAAVTVSGTGGLFALAGA